MAKLFTRQELKITKYNLMNNYGYSEPEAAAEIEGMIAVAQNNHEMMIEKEKRKKTKEKRYKKGRIQLPTTHTKVSNKD